MPRASQFGKPCYVAPEHPMRYCGHWTVTPNGLGSCIRLLSIPLEWPYCGEPEAEGDSTTKILCNMHGR